MVLPQYSTLVTMKPGNWQDQFIFVGKVIGVSAAIAIAIKTLAPQVPIPATSAMSLVIVLTPALVMGIFLAWQLQTSNHADPPNPRSD